MAPLLKENWQERLLDLKSGWNSYGALPITPVAIATIEQFATVPTSGGGINLEIHRDGYDIEVEVGPDGKIIGCLMAHEVKNRLR